MTSKWNSAIGLGRSRSDEVMMDAVEISDLVFRRRAFRSFSRPALNSWTLSWRVTRPSRVSGLQFIALT